MIYPFFGMYPTQAPLQEMVAYQNMPYAPQMNAFPNMVQFPTMQPYAPQVYPVYVPYPIGQPQLEPQAQPQPHAQAQPQSQVQTQGQPQSQAQPEQLQVRETELSYPSGGEKFDLEKFLADKVTAAIQKITASKAEQQVSDKDIVGDAMLELMNPKEE